MICFLNSFLIALFTFIYLIMFSLIHPLVGIDHELIRIIELVISIALGVWTKNKVMPVLSRGRTCEVNLISKQ
ncbi:hypothetical protein [Piscibacillus salipiscarius]|uniref:hypothetical protein n=1 Tax=Piscibacillus salipiscarius TaxID=299480 RepID=UPI0006D1A17C|nr:hypothetical protein [Piscibacillus salipiscarius]